MINPKIIQTAASILSLLRPVLLAAVGGLMVVGVERCSKPEPIIINLTNQAYEKQLSDIQKSQDSLKTHLPSIDQSLQYLSKRYGAGR